MILSPGWRKVVLLGHVASSVGLLGAVGAFLALAIAGLGGAPVYSAMAIVTWQLIVPLAFAALLVGIISALATPWGLLRYYWIVAKLLLTVLAVGVLLLQTRTIATLATATNLASLREAQMAMILHSAGGLGVLLLATLLSIVKPRGLTPWGTPAKA